MHNPLLPLLSDLTTEALHCYWFGALVRYSEIYYLDKTPEQLRMEAAGQQGQQTQRRRSLQARQQLQGGQRGGQQGQHPPAATAAAVKTATGSRQHEHSRRGGAATEGWSWVAA